MNTNEQPRTTADVIAEYERAYGVPEERRANQVADIPKAVSSSNRTFGIFVAAMVGIVVLVGLIFVATTENASSSSSTSNSVEAVTDMPVGSAVTATNSGGSAEISVVAVQRTAGAVSSYGSPSKHGNYVVITVEYAAKNGDVFYGPNEWALRDKSGYVYDVSSSLGSGSSMRSDGLGSGTLSTGDRAKGVVIIDAPTGPLTVQYRPLGSGTVASWSVS